MQPGGELVAVGSTGADLLPTANQGIGLLRVLANGDLDATFGIGGRVRTDLPPSGASGSALVLQPDGKIVVAGRANAGGMLLARSQSSAIRSPAR